VTSVQFAAFLSRYDNLSEQSPTPTSQPCAPTAPVLSPDDCHPAYTPCIPNYLGDALNCGDLNSTQRPVTVINFAYDPYKLDRDNDGLGCES